MKIIDLRSDTVTFPSPEMRKAMSEAEVGDDVYGEDPTVNRLEVIAAEKMGKEAALFTTSGTQSNLIAVLSQTRPGNEIILGSESHIFWYEVGGASFIGGVAMHTVPNDDTGRLDLNDIEHAIRTENIHYPETALLCLENTQNRCGGTILTQEYTREVSNFAHAHGVKVHLDGARIFNAVVALGVPASKLTSNVDSVGFCLSKGLGAPVGSVLCGSKEFVEKARKFRKVLGGGMRQSGILAAAGIFALETMVNRLAEDHDNARKLATGLAHIKGITVPQKFVPTNIVMFELDTELSEDKFTNTLIKLGVKLSPRGHNLFRAVTHYGISASDIDSALTKIRSVCKKLQKGS